MRAPLYAEFADAPTLVEAIARARERGVGAMDAFTPYPVRAVEEALRLRRPILAWLVFLGAWTGAAVGYFIQWLTNARLYPLDVGGRPPHSPPAFVPIAFETAILFAAGTALLVLLAACRLPRLWHPVFEVPGFERASVDRFWLAVDALDPTVARPELGRLLSAAGALRVEWPREAAP